MTRLRKENVKHVNIVPEDGTLLINGVHITLSQEDMAKLAIDQKCAHMMPTPRVRSVRFYERHRYATVEFEAPEAEIITLDEFEQLFGHCLDAHKDEVAKLEKVREEHHKQDVEQTIRIAKHEAAAGMGKDSDAWRRVNEMLEAGVIDQAYIDSVPMKVNKTK